MASTPIYNWPTPDNTGLVKNGALDMRSLGNAIDASMADLKGGTTGQVLAKASNTDMDFTWSTASGGSNLFYAGKNKVINGDFGVWQRGTSFTVANDTYTADRFLVAANGGQTMAFTQQTFTAGTAPVSGYEGRFFYQYAVTAAGSGNSYNQLKTRIEGARTLAGQTATISFWAKGSASYNITTVGYQSFGTGGSPSGSVLAWSSGNFAVTTSWQRFSYSFTMPSVSGKTFGTNGNDYVELYINMPTNQTSTTGIWGVQLEAGSTATDFVTASGNSFQGELAMCQRYYQVITAGAAVAINNTTQVVMSLVFPTMRTNSITFALTGPLRITDVFTADFTQSPAQITTNQNNGPNGATVSFGSFSGLTAYRNYSMTSFNQITASAEL
jgi:hypothetical protein